ncbi:MAG: hypothetical protein ACR2KG_02420 [Nocardioidaceae bacterium]
MSKRLVRLRARYGANPLHLLVSIGCFALAGFAALRTVSESDWPLMLVWFAAAVIGHDFVLYPLYAVADRSLAAALHAVRRGGRKQRLCPSALNYLRVPALGSGLLLLLFFPGIVRQGADSYLAATGQTQQPFLERWLLITGVLFATSAVAYAARLVFSAHQSDPAGIAAQTDEAQNVSHAATEPPDVS